MISTSSQNPFVTPAKNLKNSSKSGDGDGLLTQNLVYFARVLRDSGLRVGPALVLDALEALKYSGISNRDDFYWVLHANFVKRREDHATFHEAFQVFWQSRQLMEKLIEMLSPVVQNSNQEEEQKKAASQRVDEAFRQNKEEQKEEPPEPEEVEFDAQFTVSGREVLKSKDFAMMSVAELDEAREAMRGFQLFDEKQKTRRFMPIHHAKIWDARKMMRDGLRSGGDLILPKYKKHREQLPPFVVLVDISGSMSQYSRMFLHFLHALMDKRRDMHVFLFGTRLSNVTRALKMKDPDEAILEVTDQVEDWEGGTRIADAIGKFNRQWLRRVLSQKSTLLMITDGLERDSDGGLEKLSFEMDRLHRSCKRLVWLNPLLRFDEFEARASGIRTIMPHVDEFRAIHSLDALSSLCQALSKGNQTQNNLKAKHNNMQQTMAAN
jgi:uncharacterized protein with von Willebrand factor type A (vWA) domain